MPVYCASKGIVSNFDFKKDYRKTEDYKKELKRLISDFTAFQDYIELRDDRFIEIDPFSVLPYLNENSDFNDFFYYFSFQDQGIPIVTHDQDFIFQDIPILTAHPALLRLMRRH